MKVNYYSDSSISPLDKFWWAPVFLVTLGALMALFNLNGGIIVINTGLILYGVLSLIKIYSEGDSLESPLVVMKLAIALILITTGISTF